MKADDEGVAVVLGGAAGLSDVAGYGVCGSVERAAAGVAILRWIAEEGARIEGGVVRLVRTSPVVQAALAWGAASDRG